VLAKSRQKGNKDVVAGNGTLLHASIVRSSDTSRQGETKTTSSLELSFLAKCMLAIIILPTLLLSYT